MYPKQSRIRGTFQVLFGDESIVVRFSLRVFGSSLLSGEIVALASYFTAFGGPRLFQFAGTKTFLDLCFEGSSQRIFSNPV